MAIVLLLALMVVVPPWAGARREVLRSRIENQLAPARTDLLETQRAFASAVAATRGYLITRDPAFLAHLRQSLSQVRNGTEQFAEASAQLGPDAARPSREFLAQATELIAYHAEVLDGGIDPDALIATLTIGQERLESVKAAADRVDAALDRIELDAQRRIRESERSEDALVASLGLAALVVSLFVAGLMRRLSALSRRIAARANEEAALHELAQALSDAVSVDQIAQRVTRAASGLTGGVGAYLEYIDADADAVHVLAASGEGTPSGSTPIPHPASLDDYPIETIDLALLSDADRADKSLTPYLVNDHEQYSRLVVPLVDTKGVVGALVVVQSRRQERRLHTREDAYLRAMADLATTAIRRASLVERLRESDERFRSLAENLGEAIWISDPDFSAYHYINPAYEAIWGRSVASARENPRSFVDSVHPDDRPRVEFALEGYSHGDYNVEYRILRPNGNVRWISARAYPVRDERGNIFRIAGIARDVTERNQTEREGERLLESEQAARAVAEAALHLRDRVLRIVSHDLKNPLHTIGMVADLLEMPLTEQERAIQIGIIRRTVNRANRMVLDLLDAVRLQSGSSIPITPAPVDVERLLEELGETVRVQTEAKGQNLVWEITAGLSTVHADRDRLLQVLTNLLDNAVKFTPEGGRISVHAALVDSSTIEFQVADTGRGIPVEVLPRLFDPFAQAKDTASLGTGLGLSIARGIVEAHGGRISVESRPGQGTTFRFTMSASDHRGADQDRAESSAGGS